MIKAIRKRLTLAATLVLFVFGVMLASFIVGFGIIFIIHLTGVLDSINMKIPWIFLFVLLFICTMIGIALTTLLSKTALMSIRRVIEATHKVAHGDFDVQINIKGISELEELSQSFNKMTQELSNIETLRGDFINNFSHEFKTPIVSIRGFAKLLKEGNLTEREKSEYIDIIITESERLAELSVSILNLSKYENTDIVTDKVPFRIDEQIRRVIIITESKWTSKDIAMDVEMDEIIYEGNEDLLQQIWLNLLDNAIKFSNPHGVINIRLTHWNHYVRFTMQDNGIGMNEETMSHIFDKFYQGDASHSKAGNGLGLVIVKRIVELCNGTIEVQSEPEEGSKFIILLPEV